MPTTEVPDFLERVHAALALAPEGGLVARDVPPGDESLFETPMQDLAAGFRRFAEVYGASQEMLSLLAAAADDAGDAKLSALIRAFARGIGDGSLRPVSGLKPARRFTDFVYPVL